VIPKVERSRPPPNKEEDRVERIVQKKTVKSRQYRETLGKEQEGKFEEEKLRERRQSLIKLDHLVRGKIT